MTKTPNELLIEHVEELLKQAQANGDFEQIFYKRHLLERLKDKC